MATKPILYDPYGRPIEREVLKAEIAAPTLTGVRSPYSGYPGDGLNPRRLATILREADDGEPMRYMELAEQIEERDLHYAGVLGTRKRSVAQLDITVEAVSDDKADVDRADMIRAWLTRDELQDEMFDMLDAIGKGWSFTEIIWDTSEGQWRPSRLEYRDPRWFLPHRQDGATPLLRADEGNVPLPFYKFVVARIKAKSGLPVRSGLARLATWSWMFKAFTQRDWAIFAQTFGQPIRVGKYGPGATEEDKGTLFRAVANIAGDCAAIIPQSMELEFVESKNVTAGTDLYEKRADWLDRQISKAVLGQTATTDAIAGGHAVGKEHRKVQEDIERADARALAAVINRDLVRAWIDLEYGPQKSYPRIRIGRQEERDIKQLVESVKELVPMGLRVERSWMADQLGIPDPDASAELLTSAPQSASPAVPEIALNAQITRDAIDDLADDAETLAQGAADELIDVVRALIEDAETLDAVRDGLLRLRPQMTADDLAQAMRLALAFAELSGRADIADA